MSGYAGNSDLEAEHALILSENGIHASREAISGRVLEYCVECGEKINPLRVEFARKHGIKCEMCVGCQEVEDKKPKSRIKMLDRIL